MGGKQAFRLLFAFSFLVIFIHTHSVARRPIYLGSAIALSMGGLYGIYKWYNADYSNAELCEQAQKLYDALHEKHGSNIFLYRSGLEAISESQLHALVGHKDISRLEAVSRDLPQLQEMIVALKKRIKNDKQARVPEDEDLRKWHDELERFRKKLNNAALFWAEQAPFFALHKTLESLTAKYKEFYDLNTIPNEQELLDVLQRRIARDIRNLSNKAKQCQKYDILWSNAIQLIAELDQLDQIIVKKNQQKKEHQKPATNEQATQTGE